MFKPIGNQNQVKAKNNKFLAVTQYLKSPRQTDGNGINLERIYSQSRDV